MGCTVQWLDLQRTSRTKRRERTNLQHLIMPVPEHSRTQIHHGRSSTSPKIQHWLGLVLKTNNLNAKCLVSFWSHTCLYPGYSLDLKLICRLGLDECADSDLRNVKWLQTGFTCFYIGFRLVSNWGSSASLPLWNKFQLSNCVCLDWFQTGIKCTLFAYWFHFEFKLSWFKLV